MFFPGYRVTILVNNVALPEYDTATLTPSPSTSGVPSTSCYIESMPNAEFKMEVERTSDVPSMDTFVYVELDGVRTTKKHFRKATMSTTIEGKESRGLVAPFKFDKVQLGDSDDEGLVADEKIIKNLGTIKLLFHACVLGEPKPHTAKSLLLKSQEPLITSQPGVKVHEKSKKGLLSNVTALGEPKADTPRTHTVFINQISPHPFFEATFQYRSAALLEALGIAVIPIPTRPFHVSVPAVVPPPHHANAPAQLNANAAIIEAEIYKGVRIKGAAKFMVEKGCEQGKGNGKRVKQDIITSPDDAEGYAVVGRRFVKRAKVESESPRVGMNRRDVRRRNL